jgi:hypothetical protein
MLFPSYENSVCIEGVKNHRRQTMTPTQNVRQISCTHSRMTYIICLPPSFYRKCISALCMVSVSCDYAPHNCVLSRRQRRHALQRVSPKPSSPPSGPNGLERHGPNSSAAWQTRTPPIAEVPEPNKPTFSFFSVKDRRAYTLGEKVVDVKMDKSENSDAAA